MQRLNAKFLANAEGALSTMDDQKVVESVNKVDAIAEIAMKKIIELDELGVFDK